MTEKPETITQRGSEAGFTLVEALTAIVILIFGLMAVMNLFFLAASSNTVANQSSAATAVASQVMDRLRSTGWDTLVQGGSIVNNPTVPPSPPNCGTAAANAWLCTQDIPGVGGVVVQWQVSPMTGTARAIFIRVRAEGTGALTRARSRAEFTTIRSCTDSSAGVGCPPAP